MLQAALSIGLNLAFLFFLVLKFLLLVVLFEVVQFILVHLSFLSSNDIELVLVRAVIATNQRLLLNCSVLLFDLKMSINLLIWLPAIQMNISEFLDLLLVSFVIVVLQHINFLGVCEVNNLFHCLLSLDFKAHESFLLLMHDHGDDFNQLMSNRLVLLSLFHLNWWLL